MFAASRGVPARGRQPQLVIMVKAPVAGSVKTRLAEGMGFAPAAAFYRHATSALLRRLALHPGWCTWLGVAPDSELASRVWRQGPHRFAQGGGDLGARMQRVMDGLPPGPVVIIGSDIPGIRPRHIKSAFRALGGHDAVFGPAPDGGYWLVGLKRFPRTPQAFSNVRWSSRETLADTLANVGGLDVAMLGELDDVDTVEDLKAFGGTTGRVVV